MRVSRGIADLFREQIVPTILRAGEAAERDAGVIREIGGDGAKDGCAGGRERRPGG